MPPAPASASAPAPPRRPIPEELKNVYLMMAIQEAPESTIRTVLRALCGDAEYKARIVTLMFNKKLPLRPEAITTAAEASTSASGSRKRKAPSTEICIQCDEPFEEGDKSVTCKHHLFDMELDEDDETWLEMPIFPEEIADTPTKYPGDVKESSSEEDDADEETDEDNDNPEGRVEGKEKDGDEKEATSNAIALAPEDTVRAVLRALTADDVFKSRIATLMAKLPLRPATTAAENSGESNDASKKQKAATAQICIQCDELFEEGDTSETCSYHPYDMELDTDAPGWIEWPRRGVQETEIMRRENPDGFVYPCCEALGSEGHVGCTIGRHRAADGKRGKFPGSDDESSSEEEEKETEEDEDENDGGK
ncbi:hypothetical protein GE21DRAFT_3838 [Neurospora crassa]|uniref:Uncharacterized protein n=1 Tax=Neurospora crassa (strain ATCC 24698 / 74-OR23-1A / CBS 708.71 / DSM 1257 / FGSC 987) TaxID=367110 RepID=Q7S337_NEUCR|nr:hypothetical protein NCU09178 [Neurospora crassa OR74A]EAA29852.2 hypothetical protein NCU09178 [Neurospora crassa OR74A]KHE84341.1 hypothetical protein GE21DRAFT_3838 [Neurospora crassa]|eukprot:XP_959088.2 hypothetical protein NCU09178 [Neurospora crassa OR74A]